MNVNLSAALRTIIQKGRDEIGLIKTKANKIALSIIAHFQTQGISTDARAPGELEAYISQELSNNTSSEVIANKLASQVSDSSAVDLEPQKGNQEFDEALSRKISFEKIASYERRSKLALVVLCIVFAILSGCYKNDYLNSTYYYSSIGSATLLVLGYCYYNHREVKKIDHLLYSLST